MQNIEKIIANRYPLRDVIRKLETSIYKCKDDVLLNMFHAKSELERFDREGDIDKIDVALVNGHLSDLGETFKNYCGIYQKIRRP